MMVLRRQDRQKRGARLPRNGTTRKATRDMYLDAKGNVVDGKSLYTHYAVGVPGTVAGMEHALKTWGTMPLAKVVAPAAALAEQGYPVSETLAKVLLQTKKNMGQWPATQAIFWKNGEPLKPATCWCKKTWPVDAPDRQQGAKAFYEGAIAQKNRRRNGIPRRRPDAARPAQYKVVEREPTRGTYRGYEIVTMPPPSSGGPHLVQILNMLEPLAHGRVGPEQRANHPPHGREHEAGLRRPREYLGDPDFVKIPLKGLTSKRYADRWRRYRPQPRSHARDQARQAPAVRKRPDHALLGGGQGRQRGGRDLHAEHQLWQRHRRQAGTGILLNNEMDDFSPSPAWPISANGLKNRGFDHTVVQG
jgi:gamma-glutamyltranspeptidase/glutathione hydrolase